MGAPGGGLNWDAVFDRMLTGLPEHVPRQPWAVPWSPSSAAATGPPPSMPDRMPPSSSSARPFGQRHSSVQGPVPTPDQFREERVPSESQHTDMDDYRESLLKDAMKDLLNPVAA